MSSLNVMLIGDLYTGKKRTAAMGYNQSVFSVGAASLSTVGGALSGQQMELWLLLICLWRLGQ